jgi:LytR cell envelope-related transcriptional attenuator
VDTAAYPAQLGERELAGPWRRAALVAVGVAALELIALIVVVAALAGRSLIHHTHAAAPAARTPHVAAPARPVVRAPAHHAPPLARARTHVLVLNGNGIAGAAHTEAASLQTHGYPIASTGNAQRTDYAATIVMYRQGFDREAHRLARDAGIHLVAPLDGLTPRSLHGAQLVVVTGR